MLTKKCSKCLIIKPNTDFHKRTSNKDGRRNDCKVCVKEKHDKIRDHLRKNDRVLYQKNHEAFKLKSRIYHSANKKRRNEQSKIYRASLKGRARFLYLAAKKRAQEKGKDFNITIDLIELLLRLGCARTGINFDLSGRKNDQTKNPFGASIDRKNNKKGYTIDNIQLVCNMFNCGKSDHAEIDFIAMCLAVAEKNLNNVEAINRLKDLRDAGL